MWAQGPRRAPQIVSLCLERWRRLNPDFQLCVLNFDDACTMLSEFPIHPREVPLQAFSDILRVRLLKEYGGIWVDATVLPISPLKQWFNEAVEANDFFAFRRVEPYSDPQARTIAPWFLASRPGSLILERWYAAIIKYWSHKRQPLSPALIDQYLRDPLGFMIRDENSSPAQFPYHWCHHLFERLLIDDTRFRIMANKSMTRTTAKPHMAQYFLREWIEGDLGCRDAEASRELELGKRRLEHLHRIFASSDIQKMDWRLNTPIKEIEEILKILDE